MLAPSLLQVMAQSAKHDHSHEHDHDCSGSDCGHESHSHSHGHEHSHASASSSDAHDCAGAGCGHESHSHSHGEEGHSHSHGEEGHSHSHGGGHHHHKHDDAVGSMSLSIEGDMDLDKVRLLQFLGRGGSVACRGVDGCEGLAGPCTDVVALLRCAALLPLPAQPVCLLCAYVSPPRR